jgi:AcrR family transcriptional regulator
MGQRQAATDKTRERILAAGRKVLLAPDFSEFTMEAVGHAADVSRLTVYYQFDSKAGLLEALYNYMAQRGEMETLAEVFRYGDPIQMLAEFVKVFANFWGSDREIIRRLHALAAIDVEVGKGIRARNERRRHGVLVIVERYCKVYHPLTPPQVSVAVDSLHMLTSFETFDALAESGRKSEEVVEIIRKLAYHAIGFRPRFVPH